MLNRLIDKGVLKDIKNKKERDYLGGSSLGEECWRKLKYQAMNTPKDFEHTARTLMIFETGNMFEELAIKWIRLSGIKIETHDKNGNQFCYSSKDGRFKCHIDGKLIGAKNNRLWECKSMADKYFNKLVKEGVEKSNFSYYVQMQVYMLNMGLNKRSGLFTVVNKNNCEIYNEWVDFNPKIAEIYTNKAYDILEYIDNENELPREYPNKLFYKCKMCAWRNLCWKE